MLTHSPRIITDGLVLCLDAANRQSYPGSGTVWRDLAGSNNGTLTNGPTFSSANGGSIVFDGSDDYVDCGITSTNSIRGGNQFTLSFWAKKTASNKDLSVGAWYHTSRQGFFLEWYSDNNIYFGNSSGGVNNNIASLAWYNNWVNLIGVFDGSQSTNADKGKIYINGVISSQTASGLNTTSVSTYLAKFYIGFVENWIEYSQASIAYVTLYNRALTPTEILQNYNATKGRYNL